MAKQKSTLRTDDSIIIPRNPLCMDTSAAETISRCKHVVQYLAATEHPFMDEFLDAAEGHILDMVSEALEFAQAQIEDLMLEKALDKTLEAKGAA